MSHWVAETLKPSAEEGALRTACCRLSFASVYSSWGEIEKRVSGG
jgi:hypothetical protein